MTNIPHFIIDTNILIDSYHRDYSLDICPGFWDLMKKGFETGLIISHSKVYTEIKKGSDQLWDWVSQLDKSAFPDETDDEFLIYNELCQWAKSQKFKDAAIEKFCNSDYADPWICAKAKCENLILVTQEVPDPRSKKDIKLPDVCESVNVSYCNKYKMLRKLNACFVLDKNHRF